MASESNYGKMWDDFARSKSASYLNYKFKPTHRVGMTNYLRESLILKLVDPQSSDVVLDAGCASGKQIFALAPKITKGIGTDIAQTFIEQAQSHAREKGITNTEFLMAVLEHLPLEDASVDKFICGEVLEHVADKDEALTELLRVLKPGGTGIISVPNMNADATVWGRYLRKSGKRKFVPMEHFSKEELLNHGDAHVREFTAASLRSWLEGRGLKVVSLHSVSFLDGPKFDFLLKIPLHWSVTRSWILAIERWFTEHSGFYGRHLVVKFIK